MADAKQVAQEVLETLRREVHFGRHDVQPATALYIQREDRLRVLVFNSLAAAEVDVELRLQLADGQVIPMLFQFFPTSNRANNTFEVDLSEGFLLDLSATTPTTALRCGACYVVAQIIRGTGANAIVMRSLLANYVTTGLSIGWPEGPNQASVQGIGLVRSVQVSNPAAGADWSVAVPTGARWLLQAINATFATSATVANRFAEIQLKDGSGNLLFQDPPPSTQAAGGVQPYSWTGGVTNNANANINIGPIPDVMLCLQGFTIGTSTASIQAGDQWSAISLCVVEWIEQ